MKKQKRIQDIINTLYSEQTTEHQPRIIDRTSPLPLALPTTLKRQHGSYEIDQPDTDTKTSKPITSKSAGYTILPEKPKRLKPIAENSFGDTDIVYDVLLCYFRERDCGEIDKMLHGLVESDIKCCNYETDFSPAESVLFGMSKLLFISKRIVMVLSPLFFQNKRFMFLLDMAATFCVEHNKDALIPVLVNTEPSDIPPSLNLFSFIDTKDPGWLLKLLRQLKSEVRPLNAKGNISYIDMEDLSSLRSVSSEPPSSDIDLSAKTKDQIKIYIKKTYGKINCKEIPVPTEITCDKVSTTKGVADEIIFACQLYQEKKTMCECSKELARNNFSFTEGDVLEICEINTSSDEVQVKNSLGQITMIPKCQLIPSVFLLPSSAVKLTKERISEGENLAFENALKSMGWNIYKAITRSCHPDPQYINVNPGDILCKLSEWGDLDLVKNCRNEIGYIDSQWTDLYI